MAGDEAEAEQRLRAKQEFYAGLDSATASEDDETPDPGRHESVQAMQKGALRKLDRALVKDKNSNGLSRSISDTSLTDMSKQRNEAQRLEDRRPTTSAGNGRLPASLITRHMVSGAAAGLTARAAPSSDVPKAIRKRKRSSDSNQVPEDQQVFKGLIFYFFPNTDKHPARKMRIAKALEYGATWQNNFNDSVTHVVLDKAMDFGLLIKFLKRDRLPWNVVVVSESYPAECISYRALLDPKQLPFKVKGYEPPSAARPASSDSDRSLHLKPAGKAVMARRPETQKSNGRASLSPDAEPSHYIEADSTGKGATAGRKIVAGEVQSTEELDAAIRQAREFRHVPLDNDEDGVSRPSSSEGPNTDDEKQSDGISLLKKRKTKAQGLEAKWQCMQKHTGSKTKTPNATTIAILQ